MVTDKSNMIQVLEDFPKQCREALDLAKEEKITEKIKNIVVIGMGGSAIGGDLLKTYLSGSAIPVFVNRDYDLPGFVDENTLVFAVSYSGNTEETLSSYRQAVEKKANIVAITSGGKLAEQCRKKIMIPPGFQPRNAIAYLFFPMLGVLYNSGITEVKNNDLNEMLAILREKDKIKDKAEKIAKRLRDKTPVIYSSEVMQPVAYRWKCQINENSKHPAFSHIFPEMNHNELVGYRLMDRRQYSAVIIRDSHDHQRIKKRMEICTKLMEKSIDVNELDTEGKSLLARMFYAIYMGDLISYYLALYNRVDPTPVDVIENLKKSLKK